MLQAFLQQLVPALEESVKLAVPLGILLAIILPLPDQSIRRTFTRVLKWGFFLSVFMTAVRVGTRSAVNREIFESMAIGVDLVDILSDGISAVYCYYDPDFADLSIGRYSLYQQILLTQQLNLRWIYLGYYVKDCPSLAYKGEYKPFERLKEYVDLNETPTWGDMER